MGVTTEMNFVGKGANCMKVWNENFEYVSDSPVGMILAYGSPDLTHVLSSKEAGQLKADDTNRAMFSMTTLFADSP